MKVLIEKVHQKYEDGNCYESWIQAQLASNHKIKIFDPDCLIPKDYESKIIECMILLMIWEEAPYFTELHGIYLGKYKISSIEREKYKVPNYLNDLSIDKKNYFENLYAFQTKDGVFFVEKDRLKGKEGEEIEIKVFRFDIFAWLPIQ
ncbi:MAG: hypothetical protein ACFFA6_10590 [Promethearchaeota archaeon]